MSQNDLLWLANELEAALNEYLEIQADLEDAQKRLNDEDDEPTPFDLRAIGSILHDVYNGAESVCQLIAKNVDRNLPTGTHWHRALLDQMRQPLPETRPAVLRPETVSALEAYRSFRHVVRHIYGFHLDWSQIEPLLEKAPETIDQFRADIEHFINFLRMMQS